MKNEFSQHYMQELSIFLRTQQALGKTIYPANTQIFATFNLLPFDKVRVIILGQDPYHGDKQAHGLSFSVPKGIKIPPSLLNIYKELAEDLGIKPAQHGCLTSWNKQGVLLLNSVLTVEQNLPASHKNKGWEKFTDQVITILSQQKKYLVFMLWGNYAKNKAKLIDSNKHLLLYAAHPSPFSANHGFFGSRHFSKCNNYLINHNLPPINWKLN